MDPETRTAIAHLQSTAMEHDAQLKTHTIDIDALKKRPSGNITVDVRIFAFLTFCLVVFMVLRR
jgi:hypothetical protein